MHIYTQDIINYHLILAIMGITIALINWVILKFTFARKKKKSKTEKTEEEWNRIYKNELIKDNIGIFLVMLLPALSISL